MKTLIRKILEAYVVVMTASLFLVIPTIGIHIFIDNAYAAAIWSFCINSALMIPAYMVLLLWAIDKGLLDWFNDRVE